MQEVMHDGSLGEMKTADTLEDLIPMIKKSLAHPRVKYVKIFNNGNKVQIEQERTTDKEEFKSLSKEMFEDNRQKRVASRTFPRKRR